MRKWRLSAIVLLAVAAIVALLTFLDYGITWDEEHSSANGRYFLQWYSSGFEDRSVVNDNNQSLYGSFFNGISRLLASDRRWVSTRPGIF